MAQNNGDNARKARRLCEQGLWPEVLSFAQQWHKDHPADYLPLFYTGLGHSGLKQFPQAETAYRQALALNGTDARVWDNLAGVLYENLQRHTEGISLAEQAVKINPGHKVGWANLATMVGRLGKYEQAMTYAECAIALDSKFVEAYLHKASAGLALGRLEVVKEICQTLAAIEPEKFRRAR